MWHDFTTGVFFGLAFRRDRLKLTTTLRETLSV